MINLSLNVTPKADISRHLVFDLVLLLCYASTVESQTFPKTCLSWYESNLQLIGLLRWRLNIRRCFGFACRVFETANSYLYIKLLFYSWETNWYEIKNCLFHGKLFMKFGWCCIWPDVHGRNLVGDTGDVSPSLFQTGRHNMPCPPYFFLFRFCTWRGLKNKSDVCHILCEELFMLDGRPYIAKLMLEQSLMWDHWFC